MKKHLLAAVALFMAFVVNAQWLPQNAGFTNDTLGFYEISIVNPNTAWTVCYGKNGLFGNVGTLDFTRTTDGGITWTPGKMGNDQTLRFSNISAISETEAWVAMHKRNFSKGGGLFHTTDGGVTWEHLPFGEAFDANSSPNFVHFKDKNKGIAIGDPNAGYWEVHVTMNGGKKWKRVPQDSLPAALPNESGWISGYASVDKTIWFGTSHGRMYKSTNFGKNWTVSMVDPTRTVFEIAFNDDGLRGVAHLRDNFGTYLYSTVDGGTTWNLIGQPLNWKSSRITSVPGTDALVSTSVNGFDRGSALSYDNGATWTEIDKVPRAACRFYDANTGWSGSFFLTGPPLRGGLFKSAIVFETPLLQKGKNESMKPPVQTSKPIPADLVSVYPVPAKHLFNLSFTDALARTSSIISLINVDGRVIESKRSAGAKTIQWNVSGLPPGLYLLRIQTSTQTINKAITIGQ